MKALGMIEVYGYLAAVEALDSALKAANVKMVDVTLVHGGLVAVLITGDVGAVKAAIDASKTAAERVGRVISVHVIPRPSEQVTMLLPSKILDTQASPEVPKVTELSESPEVPKAQELSKVPELSEAPGVPKALEVQENMIQSPEPVTQLRPTNRSEESQEVINPVSTERTEEPKRFTEKQLTEMTVDRLRSLARKLGITSMTKKEIRFATKHELIDAISKFIEQER